MSVFRLLFLRDPRAGEAMLKIFDHKKAETKILAIKEANDLGVLLVLGNVVFFIAFRSIEATEIRAG